VLDVAEGFEFQGLYAFPAPQGDAAYYYLPLTPSPEVDAQGRPTLLTVPLGQGGFVQLGTRLEAQEKTLQALRAVLAARLALPGAGQVSLNPAPLTVRGADLEVGDGTGKFTALAHSTTSGFPPYTALFHAQTDATQQAAVSAALNGRSGFLQVSYLLALQWPVHVEARLHGNARALLAELVHASAEEVRPALANELLDEALARGNVQLELEASEHAPDALVRRATDQARAQFVTMLLQADARLPDAADTQAVIRLDESVDLPQTLLTDVSTWFGGTGAHHIILPPSTAEPP
jgi:hypothetical protein